MGIFPVLAVRFASPAPEGPEQGSRSTRGVQGRGPVPVRMIPSGSGLTCFPRRAHRATPGTRRTPYRDRPPSSGGWAIIFGRLSHPPGRVGQGSIFFFPRCEKTSPAAEVDVWRVVPGWNHQHARQHVQAAFGGVANITIFPRRAHPVTSMRRLDNPSNMNIRFPPGGGCSFGPWSRSSIFFLPEV